MAHTPKRRKLDTKNNDQLMCKNEWTDLCTECFHAILSNLDELSELVGLDCIDDEFVSEATWMELWNSETQKLWKTLSQQSAQKLFMYVQFMSHLIQKQEEEDMPSLATTTTKLLPLSLVHKLLTYMGKQKAKSQTLSDVIEKEMKQIETTDHEKNEDLEAQEEKELQMMFGDLKNSNNIRDDDAKKCPDPECGWTLEKFGLQIRSADEGYTWFWTCKNRRCLNAGKILHRVN